MKLTPKEAKRLRKNIAKGFRGIRKEDYKKTMRFLRTLRKQFPLLGFMGGRNIEQKYHLIELNGNDGYGSPFIMQLWDELMQYHELYSVLTYSNARVVSGFYLSKV